MRILILFNRARELRKGVASDLACEQEIEIIVPIVEQVLRAAGHEIEHRAVDQSLWGYLAANSVRYDLVFNLAEGFGGTNADEPLIPAMLEALQMSFTGAASANMQLTLDKEKTKLVLKGYGIAVPDYQIVRAVDDIIERRIAFPIIVKPIREEASVGIYYDNVVTDDNALQRKCRHIVTVYKQPAIFEPYITGRELSVGVIGNYPNLTVFPPLEFLFPDARESERAFRSYEYKWGGEKERMVRAEISEELSNFVIQQSRIAFAATECRDYARMDFRVDAGGEPFLLEVNYNPGIGPNTHGLNNTLTMMASFDGISFSELILRIIDGAAKRYFTSPTGTRP
jgi:D-alanine-D-alanine ligase